MHVIAKASIADVLQPSLNGDHQSRMYNEVASIICSAGVEMIR
jgi:hypothetical protein